MIRQTYAWMTPNDKTNSNDTKTKDKLKWALLTND